MDIEHICQIESSLQQSMPLCLINLIVQFCVDINALYNFHTSHYSDLIDILEWEYYDDVTDFVFEHLFDFYVEVSAEAYFGRLWIRLQFENVLSLYGLDIPMRVYYERPLWEVYGDAEPTPPPCEGMDWELE